MDKNSKNDFVAEFAEKAQRAKLAIVTDHTGLSVNGMTELRKRLSLVDGAEFRVIKNTLGRRAVAGTELEGIGAFLKGPSSVLLSYSDIVQAAKVLKAFRKEHEDALPVRGGVVDGKLASEDQLQALADLPTKEVLQAMLLGVLNGPSRNLVSLLANVNRSVLNVLVAYKDKLEPEA